MIRRVIKKLLETFITLFCIASLIFLLMHFAPGSPFVDENLICADSFAALKRYYGLDLPLSIQYVKYIKGLIQLEFGPSIAFENLNIKTIIKSAFPLSLKLGSVAFLMTLIMGFFMSLLLAFSKSKFVLKISSLLNSSFLALPSFIAAVLLQYVFAIKLKIFPISGAHSIRHLLLPALSLSLIPSGIVARLFYSKLKQVMNEPYILSAKSKGISSSRLVLFHMLPGAILPTLSYLGPLAATLVTGSFACEKVFALPGLGSWFVISLSSRDYPMIAALTLFYSLFVLGFSLLIDIIASIIDPRLKRGKV